MSVTEMGLSAVWGEIAIRWTARLSVACYAARLICDARGIPHQSVQRIARWWWTAGCVIFLLHVIAAFHFQHDWEHSAAFEATRKRTAEMTGWDSGFGLYINEAFLLFWVIDTGLWWRNLDWPANRVAYWFVQFVFAFLMFQATFVFGPPIWKVVVPLIIVVLLFQRRRSVQVRR